MKKLLFIFICSIVCSSFLTPERIYAKTADTQEIELLTETEKNDVRSIYPVHALLDGQTVYILFHDQPETASVAITNMEGEAILANTYPSPQTISIPFYKPGKYQIEIHLGSKVFTGTFELK